MAVRGRSFAAMRAASVPLLQSAVTLRPILQSPVADSSPPGRKTDSRRPWADDAHESPVQRVNAPAKTCPQCGQTYDFEQRFCP
ncbi:MAG: hypothetical protein ACREND_01330, partial [Gemmatimonadaceae bacterium]